MDLDPTKAACAAVVLFLAYMVRGIAGFGSGLIAVPLLAIVFPIQFRGTALVLSLVELHVGSVITEIEIGKGTVVTIRLPPPRRPRRR